MGYIDTKMDNIPFRTSVADPSKEITRSPWALTVSWQGQTGREISEGYLALVQDYKSPRAAVMICSASALHRRDLNKNLRDFSRL